MKNKRTTRRCEICKNTYSLEKFSKNKSKTWGYSYTCIECNRKRVSQSRPLICGVSREEYSIMLNNQEGVCAICKHPNANGRRLSIDHDHFTGEIRGLLCNNCNVLLGHAKDNPYILRKALEYIEKH